MGVDARWYCLDCKTEDAPKTFGGRDLWGYPLPSPTAAELRDVIAKGKKWVGGQTSIGEDFRIPLDWLEELAAWMKQHEGHRIDISNAHMGVPEEILDAWYPSKRGGT